GGRAVPAACLGSGEPGVPCRCSGPRKDAADPGPVGSQRPVYPTSLCTPTRFHPLLCVLRTMTCTPVHRQSRDVPPWQGRDGPVPAGLATAGTAPVRTPSVAFSPRAGPFSLPFLSLGREDLFRPARGDVYRLRHERPRVALPVDINPRRRGGRR